MSTLRASWKTLNAYLLENGWTAVVNYDVAYGQHIVKLQKGDVYWQSCNGLTDLPAFAQGWIEEVTEGNFIVICGFHVVDDLQA